ncbi:spermidine resistance protein, partial [Coemansia sp. RSA 2618]
MTLSSSPTAGDAQYAVGATGNSQRESQAQTNQKPCTTPCSANGTHSDGYTGAFEGPEKLLEMWFAPHADAYCIGQGAIVGGDEWSASRSGLRRVPLGEWRDMLDLVHCQVLSTLSNQYVDSYLLSESSFFVYPHKLVLKTCGTTTLLYAIPRILDIASRYVGARGVFQLFYSRKNFMYPMEQDELHRSWGREVEYLDALFPEGAAYLIGKTNRDHWHVYLSAPHGPAAMGDATAGSSLVSSPTLNPAMSRSSSQSTVHGLPLAPDACSARSDTTVEILMTGLDPERMRV